MNFWNWLLRTGSDTPVAELARRAAALVVESIRPAVEPRISGMGIHESRGYVRARSGHLIQEAIDMVLAHEPRHTRPARDAVFNAAVEELLRTLYRRTQRGVQTWRRAA